MYLQRLKDKAVLLADDNLVPHWKRVYKFASARSLALQTALLVGWAQLPADLKAGLPTWLIPAIGIFVLVVGVAGTMYKQKGITPNGSDTN